MVMVGSILVTMGRSPSMHGGAALRQRLSGGIAVNRFVNGFGTVGIGQRPEPAAIGDHFPDVRTLGMDTIQHSADIDPAGLTPSMILDQRAQRVEMDAEAGQKAEQSRLHDR